MRSSRRRCGRRPEDRYDSVAALAEDIRRIATTSRSWRGPRRDGIALSKFVARHRTAVGIAAAVMVVILGSLGFALVQMREAQRQRDAALFEARRAEASQQLNTYLVGEARLGPGDASILERLDNSRALLRQQFAGDPAIRAGLLFNIAERYAELREQNKFGEVLDEIEGIARTVDVPSLKAQLWCSRAEMKINEGENDAAGALISAGFADLARDPSAPFRGDGQLPRGQYLSSRPRPAISHVARACQGSGRPARSARTDEHRYLWRRARCADHGLFLRGRRPERARAPCGRSAPYLRASGARRDVHACEDPVHGGDVSQSEAASGGRRSPGATR